ncbi:kelch domain-containing protein 8A isoform X5 [Mustela erminea]|nr:kelch domain-containing protein 8A isoform X5 [Mustela erminea]XP_032174823.1 kelch domain-containing protein 8A isoform X5 [Mustela erminea]
MVIGGVGTSQLPLKVVEMYNIDEGKWKKRSVLREAAMGISVTAKDYRVYAAGGMGLDLRPHNHLQHYDMLKDMWVSLAPMPTPRYAATSFLRGSKIYVLGGRQSKYAVNAFEVFDIETRSWTKFPNIPSKRAFSSFVTLDDRLYSLGGLRQGRLYRQPKFLRTMDVFDMEQGFLLAGWLFVSKTFPSIFSSYDIQAVPGEGGLLLLFTNVDPEGSRPSCSLPLVSLLSSSEPTRTEIERGGWLKMERSFFLKKRRADFVAGSLSGRVIVAGGLGNQPTVLETAEAFHPGKNKWEALPTMPTPRCACSSIVIKNCLLAVGGVSQGLSDAVEALCVSDS